MTTGRSWLRAARACLLLGATLASIGLALTTSYLFLALTGVLGAGTYAAWVGLSLWQFIDTIDDSTAPATAPG